MMGKGAEGGISHAPIMRNKVSESWIGKKRACSAHGSEGVDVFTQALKVLSVKSPFGDEAVNTGEALSTSASFSIRLPISIDSRRKNRARKTQATGKHRSSDGNEIRGEGNVKLFWLQMEDYFREITAEDVQCLLPKTNLQLTNDKDVSDPCFLIQPVGQHYTEVWAEDGGPEISAGSDVHSEQQSVRGVKRKHLAASPASKKKSSSSFLCGDMITTIISPPDADEEDLCHVCNSGDVDDGNQILFCDFCNMAVHQECYGVHKVPEGQWLCSRCSSKSSQPVPLLEASQNDSGVISGQDSAYPCILCPIKGGALKPVTQDASNNGGCSGVRFAHVFCCHWIPETYIEDTDAMEPIKNIEGIKDERWRLQCILCKDKHGACIQCSHGFCTVAFHPLCAREARLWMEASSREDSEDVDLRVYCQKHSASRNRVSFRQDECVVEEKTDASTPRALMVQNDGTVRSMQTINEEKAADVHDGMQDGLINISVPLSRMETTANNFDGQDKGIVNETSMGQNWHRAKNFVNIVRKKMETVSTVSTFARGVGISEASLSSWLQGEKVDGWRETEASVRAWCSSNPAFLGNNRGDNSKPDFDLRAVELQAGGFPVIKGSDSMPVETSEAEDSSLQLSLEKGDIGDIGIDALNEQRKNGNKEPSGKNIEISGLDIGSLEHMALASEGILDAKNGTNISMGGCQSAIGKFADTNKRSSNGNCERPFVMDKASIDAGSTLAHASNKRKADLIEDPLQNHRPNKKAAVMDYKCLEFRVTTAEDNDDANSLDHRSRCSSIMTRFDISSDGNIPESTCNMDKPANDLVGTDVKKHVEDVGASSVTGASSLEEIDQVNLENSVVPRPLVMLSSTGFGKAAAEPFVSPCILQRLQDLGRIHESITLSREKSRSDQAKALGDPEDVLSEFGPKAVNEGVQTSTFAAQWEQLQRAREGGVLDLVPEDEVEAELLILQKSLIDCAEANISASESLISKVLLQLPKEHQCAQKRAQDMFLVEQYLSAAREARKQGRKEKKDKEAQAVLAAATAAAAASPRVGYVKREGGQEGNSLADFPFDHRQFSFPVMSPSGFGGPSVPVHPFRQPIVPKLSRLHIPSQQYLSVPERDPLSFTSPTLTESNYNQLQLEISRRAGRCDVCGSGESTRSNRIFLCDRCNVAVHQECYGVVRMPLGPWYCQPCAEVQHQYQPSNPLSGWTTPGVQCALCPEYLGAFKKAMDGRWVHVFCAQWIPETSVGQDQVAPIEGLENVPGDRFTLVCSVCQRQQGACLKCNFGHCYGAFHATCARDHGLYMTVKPVSGRLQYRAYCERHSPQQRAKDEVKHEGPTDELQLLRQIRVEFERVRLICERITRREKMKRDLLNLNREIYIAELELAGKPGPAESLGYNGQSADSASLSIRHSAVADLEGLSRPETSLDCQPSPLNSNVDAKASHEPMLQKSPCLRLDMPKVTPHLNVSGSIDDSKLSGLACFSTSKPVISVGSKDRHARKLKRRHGEPLGREKVMTPTEASMHNKRLPKGYAYVPVDILDKVTVSSSTIQQQTKDIETPKPFQ